MLKKILVTSLLGMSAVAANAGNILGMYTMDKVYVGAGVGQTRMNKACDGVPYGSMGSVYAVATQCDNKDTAWRLGVGYEFTPVFTGELNYMSMGRTKTNAAYSDGGYGNGDFKADDVWAIQIGAHTPINFFNRASVYGKIGAAYSKYSSNFTTTNKSFWELSGHRVAPVFTAGAAYALNKHWDANLQLDYINKVGETVPTSHSVNATTWTLGLNYKF